VSSPRPHILSPRRKPLKTIQENKKRAREPQQCIKIMTSRIRCDKNAREDVFCSYHFSQARKNGPGIYAWEIINSEYELQIFSTIGANLPNRYDELNRIKNERKKSLEEFNSTEFGELRLEELEHLKNEKRFKADQRLARRLMQQEIIRAANELARLNVEQNAQRQDRFQQIANDNQSVHTSEVVNLVKKNVMIILKIPVPPEYAWNMNYLSKTPGEVIAECNLSLHAGCQMLTHYCSPLSVYEIGIGIYGKTLDAVWQHIKTSEDSIVLKKTLKQELEDNIGMCAQGNLTRVANILNGILEGLKQNEGYKSILQRVLPTLLHLPLEERMIKAKDVMKENNVPDDEWVVWLDEIIDF